MWSKAKLGWIYVMFCFIKNETVKGVGENISKKLLRCQEDGG